MIVAVCPFMKWVEVGILAHKDALTVVCWFYANTTCHFAVPLAVHLDRGSEFRGAFTAYL